MTQTQALLDVKKSTAVTRKPLQPHDASGIGESNSTTHYQENEASVFLCSMRQSFVDAEACLIAFGHSVKPNAEEPHPENWSSTPFQKHKHA